jgi:hypothetical protein
MIHLWSSDNSSLVLARAVLRREAKVEMNITLGGVCPAEAFSSVDLWKKAAQESVEKYKRLGIVIDNALEVENLFMQNSCKKAIPISYELLSSFANRGLSDTVEFRRLARKYLRSARNNNCDGVLFLSGILADEESCKILAKMIGTQIKPVFITEFLSEEFFVPASKQKIEIYTDRDVDRVHREAEKFLHMKLAKGCVKKIC